MRTAIRIQSVACMVALGERMGGVDYLGSVGYALASESRGSEKVHETRARLISRWS